MEKTFISVARETGRIDSLTPLKREAVLRDFEDVVSQYNQMLQKENRSKRFDKPLSIFYYASLAENLERVWNSHELPTLQQEYDVLKKLWKE